MNTAVTTLTETWKRPAAPAVPDSVKKATEDTLAKIKAVLGTFEGPAGGGRGTTRGGPGRQTGTATGRRGQGQGRGGREGREPVRERSHDHPPLVVEDEVRPLRRREGIGTNRPSSEDRSPAQVRRPGSSPAAARCVPGTGGHHRCGTAPDSHRLR